MEPENTTSVETHTKRNFSLLALLAVLVIIGVSILSLPLINIREENKEVKAVPAEKKVYTQSEKEQILAQLTAALPKDTTSQGEKERLIRTLATKVQKDTVSDEEKLRRLQTLQASSNQIN